MDTFPENSSKTQNKVLVSAAVRAFIEGVVVFLLLVLVDQISLHLGLTAAQRFADDLLGGAIVGIIIFLDERRRARYLATRLQVIALMNHHVRNALQAIKFAHQTDQQVRLIDESVARIEWALREILPTDMKDTQTVTISK
jgi:hypothetical protein